jgi:hypothetical protein
VEDLVLAASSQEKELAEKSLLVADLQEQLINSGNFLLPFCKFSTFMLVDQYSAIISTMQMLRSCKPLSRG